MIPMSEAMGGPRDGKIWKAIPAIMADVGAIGKDRKNAGQGYNFRGIDDVYFAVQLLLAKYGVFTVPEVIDDRTEERQTKSGSSLIYRVLKIRFWFYADDGSFFTAVVIGEGMDSGDKASNKAMSVAHKYAFLQVFAIPTSDPKDPENEHHVVTPSVYSGTEEQKGNLMAQFIASKVPESLWAGISERLRGRAASDWRVVWSEMK